MRIALVLTPINETHLRLAQQIGVTNIVARFPGYELEALLAIRRQVETHGLKLAVVEGYIPMDRIIHGKPGREAQIEGVKTLLRNMGQAGVPVLSYHFMPDGEWSRTSVDTPERGGALVTAFDAEDARDASPSGPITAAQLWANLEHFLRAVVPTAEAAGVKLAMHPDDPPMSPLRGQDRILVDVAAFERLVGIVDSPANGICFCQGTFAEMGVDIPAAIRRLAKRINYVHFRDVAGTVPKFRETFHDNGDTNMYEAMRVYREIGYAGSMRPDHVPTLAGESNEFPGYHMMGRLFAVGYMRGLIQAVNGGAK
jgi:mannonate dehydratase